MTTVRGRAAVCTAMLLLAGVLPLAGDPAPGPAEFAAVLAHDSCAPWDGPAVAIEFYASPTRCGQARSARLSIHLWRGLPLRAGSKFELGTSAQAGAASYCVQENHCEAAESGAAWIESFEPGKSVSGRYDLLFKKAGHLAGKFRASWCENRQLCR